MSESESAYVVFRHLAIERAKPRAVDVGSEVAHDERMATRGKSRSGVLALTFVSRLILIVVAIGLLGCSAAGAPTSEELCDRAIAAGCSTNRALCISNFDDQLTIARRWGCESEYGAQSACLLETTDAACTTGSGCTAESDAYADCLFRAMTMM